MNVMVVGLISIALYFIIAIAWLWYDQQQAPDVPAAGHLDGGDR